MAPNLTTKYNKTPLRAAPHKFYEAVDTVLSNTGNQLLTNGWKAFATLPELEISAEKVAELERKPDKDVPSCFLQYLVFGHPRKDDITVEKMEELATTVHNQTILQRFAAIKRELSAEGTFCIIWGQRLGLRRRARPGWVG